MIIRISTVIIVLLLFILIAVLAQGYILANMLEFGCAL